MSNIVKQGNKFKIRPYHLHESHKYSAQIVYSDELPDFFKALGKYIKKNPNVDLNDISLSLERHDTEIQYVFEMQWVDNGE